MHRRFSIGSLSLRLSFKLGSIGNVANFPPIKPISSSKYKIYFILLKEASLLNLVISKSKKYLNKELNVNCTLSTQEAP